MKIVYVYTKYFRSNLFLAHTKLNLSCMVLEKDYRDLLSWSEILCHIYCEEMNIVHIINLISTKLKVFEINFFFF